MVRGMFKSRSLRRVQVNTPGNKLVVHYEQRQPQAASCSKCGVKLKGVPRLRKNQLKKIGKTEKRPSRAYGGVLCSKCSRELIKQKARE
jgi:large subunit ribosomal protein L34e